MKSAVRYSLKKYTNYIGFKTMSFKIAIKNRYNKYKSVCCYFLFAKQSLQ